MITKGDELNVYVIESRPRLMDESKIPTIDEIKQEAREIQDEIDRLSEQFCWQAD